MPSVKQKQVVKIKRGIMTTTTETIKVQGVCRQCEDIVSTTLLHTRSVLNAKASYWKSNVDVTYDSDIVTASELEKTIEYSGYPVGGGCQGE